MFLERRIYLLVQYRYVIELLKRFQINLETFKYDLSAKKQALHLSKRYNRSFGISLAISRII